MPVRLHWVLTSGMLVMIKIDLHEKCSMQVNAQTIVSILTGRGLTGMGPLYETCNYVMNTSYMTISLAFDGLPRTSREILKQYPELQPIMDVKLEEGRSYTYEEIVSLAGVDLKDTYHVLQATEDAADECTVDREIAHIRRIKPDAEIIGAVVE